MPPTNTEVMIISGNTHQKMADSISFGLGLKRADISLFHAANQETLMLMPQSVRSKDCYIVQTATQQNVNDAIMELLLMGYTCKTSAAKSIVGIIPYLPYSKQAKQRKRGSIPSRLLAKLIAKSGFTTIVTVDLHHREIQGFFDVPVENLRASPFLVSHIQERIMELGLERTQVVLVARNTASVRKATAYAQRLKVPLAVLHGSSVPEAEAEDGRSSPPPFRHEVEFVPSGMPYFRHQSVHSTPFQLVGDVEDKLAIIVDNIVDDVQPFIDVARFLKESGNAQRVHLVATHALFSRDDALELNASCVDEIVVTNTVPHESQAADCEKITTIDISGLMTEAIRRLHNQESLSYLFADVTVDD